MRDDRTVVSKEEVLNRRMHQNPDTWSFPHYIIIPLILLKTFLSSLLISKRVQWALHLVVQVSVGPQNCFAWRTC